VQIQQLFLLQTLAAVESPTFQELHPVHPYQLQRKVALLEAIVLVMNLHTILVLDTIEKNTLNGWVMVMDISLSLTHLWATEPLWATRLLVIGFESTTTAIQMFSLKVFLQE